MCGFVFAIGRLEKSTPRVISSSIEQWSPLHLSRFGTTVSRGTPPSAVYQETR